MRKQPTLPIASAAEASPADLIVVAGVSRVIGPAATGAQILDDVSFTVPAASLFAINDPSGSGKSTLVNLLTGIDHSTRGEIVFDGKSIQARSENALARWRGSWRLRGWPHEHYAPSAVIAEPFGRRSPANSGGPTARAAAAGYRCNRRATPAWPLRSQRGDPLALPEA